MSYQTSVTAPDTVTVGEPFGITLEVCCDQPRPGCRSATFEPTIDGNVFTVVNADFIEDFCVDFTVNGFQAPEPSPPVEIDGEEVTITEAGTYTISHKDGSQQITVEPKPDPNPTVTGCSTPNTTVNPGDSVTAPATVVNNGGAGDVTVSLIGRNESENLNLGTVAETTVSLAAGEQRTIEFSVSFDEAGEYSLSSNARNADIGIVTPSTLRSKLISVVE